MLRLELPRVSEALRESVRTSTDARGELAPSDVGSPDDVASRAALLRERALMPNMDIDARRGLHPREAIATDMEFRRFRPRVGKGDEKDLCRHRVQGETGCRKARKAAFLFPKTSAEKHTASLAMSHSHDHAHTGDAMDCCGEEHSHGGGCCDQGAGCCGGGDGQVVHDHNHTEGAVFGQPTIDIRY